MLEKRKTALETVLNEHGENLNKKMQSMIDAASDAVTKISEHGDAASSKILTIGEKADEVVKQFARTRGILVFEPLIRTANGQSVDVNQVRDAAILAMTILLSRLPPRATHRYTLESLIKNLKDDSSLGIFS